MQCHTIEIKRLECDELDGPRQWESRAVDTVGGLRVHNELALEMWRCKT